jgi:CrcB protein
MATAPWATVVCVALGGGVGSALRFALGQWTAARFGDAFPWGTLCVNLIGSLVFGVVWGLGPSINASPVLRALLLSGLLGGFTTFSSFMFDSVQLWEAGRPGAAFSNLVLQNCLGLVLLSLGVLLARAVSAR